MLAILALILLGLAVAYVALVVASTVAFAGFLALGALVAGVAEGARALWPKMPRHLGYVLGGALGAAAVCALCLILGA
jgi:hypothetical protein